MDKQKCNIKLNILILGDSSCGKTSIINRYLNYSFNPDESVTPGLIFHKKELIIDKYKIDPDM